MVRRIDTSTHRSALARDARQGWPSRGGGKRRIAARAALARLLWTARGVRRVPSGRALDAALAANTEADLEWIFEWNPLGPIYFLPTTGWIRELVYTLRSLGVKSVLEVGAGDGVLSAALAKAAPHLQVVATDSGAWVEPEGRLSAKERRTLRERPAGLALGEHVQRLDAASAVRRFFPELVICAWVPPGPMLERVIRSHVRYVLDVGAPGGITASQWTWRFAHDFLEGPLETLGRCRLDARPAKATHTRVTLYFGRAHEDHAVERVREGDWLWQFKPR